MHNLLLLNGPNMNLLGKREPKKYGNINLSTLNSQLSEQATQLDCQLECFQSNSEAELIDKIQTNAGQAFIMFNPAAFTHTSVALRDALLATESRFIEVHITNPKTREQFRQQSYFSDIADAVIAGCGIDGYHYALQTAVKRITENQPED